MASVLVRLCRKWLSTVKWLTKQFIKLGILLEMLLLDPPSRYCTRPMCMADCLKHHQS